ncbi:MAG: hypothetical protein CM15mV89_1130 [Caudoviricetes sp.]|nr:MAG: hypothetical protein CM15mV89_1130 [Caudoviricetes sp.]
MAEDKWNPADIIAVKTSYDGRKVYKPSGKSSLQADNSEMKNAVKLIDDFKICMSIINGFTNSLKIEILYQYL